jgi:hypothetical protein
VNDFETLPFVPTIIGITVSLLIFIFFMPCISFVSILNFKIM